MGQFDPDAYLAKIEGGGGAPAGSGPATPTPTVAAPTAGFDPDAYLARYVKDETPDTVQEMHPDFTAADRLIVKNFAANDEAAVHYLQKKHPKLEVILDPASGQIKARNKGATEPYKVLDPDKGMIGNLNPFSGEFYQDLGDIGYDAAAGVGTGLATGAAGIAGGAATGGAAALPAAMAAGAGSSAGFEGLRQGLGRLLGIEDNFDAGQLAGAGIAGAASPLLFGTGGQVGKGVINQGAQKMGGKLAASLGVEAVDDAALQAAQRGGVGRLWDGVGKPLAAKIGAAASGASEESLKTLGQHYDTIRRLEQDPEAITNFTREAGKNVGTRLRGAKANAWNAYTGALETATEDGATVAVGHVSEPLKAAIAQADDIARETRTDASKELASELRSEFRRLFTYQEKVPVIDELTGLAKLEADGTPVTKLVTRELDELSPAAAARLEGALSEMGQMSKLKPDRLGVGNRFGAGQSADDKAIAQIGVEMKKLLGASMEDTLGPEAIAARGRYGEITNLEKRAAPLLKNPTKAFSTLRNADKTPNAPTAELFGRLDREFGTDLTQRAKIMDAYSTFAKPSATPLSAQGGTSTSRSIPLALAGSGLGYWAGSSQGGDGRGSGVLGGLAGGAIGGFLGSPAMMRRAIAAGIKGGAFNQGLGPLRPGLGSQVLPGAYQSISPWLGVQP